MRPGRTTVGAALLLLTMSACGADEPLAEPVQAQSSPSAAAPSPSASPSPSPSQSPSPSPAPPPSPFEGDPAVQGFRAYLAAVATAVNARDLQQPELLTRATAARAAFHPEIYGPALVGFFPTPPPIAVIGVEVVSESERSILVCSPEAGILLDAPGGQPLDELQVVGGRYRMLLESGAWKVDDALADDAVACAGVPMQPPIA